MKNPIQNWIDSNKEVKDILKEIENSKISPSDQAELAMDKLCSLLDLPKMPEDTSRYEDFYEKNGIEESRSVFQENALLKYFHPEEDPRSLIITAIYNLKNLIGVDLDEVIVREFGEKFKDDYLIGFKGNGIDGEIVFPQKEGKSWFDLGCITVTKIINLEK
ncbi:hypothetical protein [Croceivirga thetidis]|uniref:Knr4/Smi1-like domain-containing protein n=1 Tax=Croceivirga thetidis TaxID=2721623 RepID=A0ABX1GME2_9FLAO|nr:hypothetical protein [Croceivirga thetidis]NKI31044.1 hypothetical protein [Croceivirga thetidis]